MIIVSDTSPLHYLAVLGLEDVLEKLFETVLVTSTVFDELYVVADKPYIERMLAHVWLQVRDPIQAPLALQIFQKLDKGERSAIQLAKELQARLLIDEARGREAAHLLHIDVTGLLGVLLEAKSKGILPMIKPHVLRLRNETNFRIHESLLQRILQLANEQ